MNDHTEDWFVTIEDVDNEPWYLTVQDAAEESRQSKEDTSADYRWISQDGHNDPLVLT